MSETLARPPLDLPRQLMRRGTAVVLLVLVVALALGVWRMGDDITEEVDAARSTARMLARLAALGDGDDRSQLAALAELQREHPPRHLRLRVHDAEGRLLLAPPPPEADSPLLGGLLALHRRWQPVPEREVAVWLLPRPPGRPWRVSVEVSPESERREAMQSLIGVLALLLACGLGLLFALRWNSQRAFAPLGRLLDAISGIESGDTRAVRALAPMPIRELDAVAGALRHLAGALDEAEGQRRQLRRQVLTLQEDERARIARELHDEFGQRLTAMRVDAAWLARRLDGDAERQAVAAALGEQCAQIQQQIRGLLAQLQPFGPGNDAAETTGRLAAALHQLAGVWPAPRVTVQLSWRPHAAAEPGPWPDDGSTLALPRALALVLYRISQEALTNAARHAGAAHAQLSLVLTGAWRAGAPVRIDWSVQDDGRGIGDVAMASSRGNGLAGMRERVWAQGGDLRFADAGPGLRVQATLEATLQDTAADVSPEGPAA